MGNNSWINSAFFSLHLVPQNVGNIISVCYFLNIVFVIFAILSQIQIAAPFERSIPGLPRLEPHRKVNATTLCKLSQTFKTLRKTANLFSNLDFWQKSGFPKKPRFVHGLSKNFPWISHPQPPPRPARIFKELDLKELDIHCWTSINEYQ